VKKISIVLALMTLLFADLALAASAVVSSLTGAVQVQTGAAAPRALRRGDAVAQGDTVSTGASSSVVLKFDDGQVAALTSNSRMQVTAYAYNASAKTGNILFSLVVGGMRAITGLIGHNQPNSVKFRAATATIGIRGSDGSFVTDGTSVAVLVIDGGFTFTLGSETITIPAGRGVFAADGKVTEGTVQQIFRQLPPAFQEAIGGLEGLADAINQARPGEPRGSNEGGLPPFTPGPDVPPGGSSGGPASGR
jgi:hypothetical protein